MFFWKICNFIFKPMIQFEVFFFFFNKVWSLGWRGFVGLVGLVGLVVWVVLVGWFGWSHCVGWVNWLGWVVELVVWMVWLVGLAGFIGLVGLVGWISWFGSVCWVGWLVGLGWLVCFAHGCSMAPTPRVEKSTFFHSVAYVPLPIITDCWAFKLQIQLLQWFYD